MAASATTGLPVPVALPATAREKATSTATPIAHRRRRITPEAGRALEILGHAIEYLTDEYIHSGGSFSANNEQLEAVQLLMALNRQIYFECPEVPTFGQRFRTLLPGP